MPGLSHFCSISTHQERAHEQLSAHHPSFCHRASGLANNEATTSSSSLPGSLSGSSSGAGTAQQQTQQAIAAGSLTTKQQVQQHTLRLQRNSDGRTTAAISALGPSIPSTAGAASSSVARFGSETLGGFSAQPNSTGFSLEPRTWIQQAADVTDGLLDASKYKSLAVYSEVRLTEALDKAAKACPNSIAGAAPEDCDERQPLPNPLATAVCCQVRLDPFSTCLLASEAAPIYNDDVLHLTGPAGTPSLIYVIVCSCQLCTVLYLTPPWHALAWGFVCPASDKAQFHCPLSQGNCNCRLVLQLLGELADMCGPFQPTLTKLREALLPSIYSCCSGPSLAGNRPLQFDTLPWFALAGRLRRQNNQLLEQQAAFSQELAQHQVHVAHAGRAGLSHQQCKTACWLSTVCVHDMSSSPAGS
jgi:hypothetical protein